MLYDDQVAVDLAPKVVETLLALVERAGEIVSKDELMERLWSDSHVEEGNLTQNIYLLRKILGDTSSGQPMIETFRRRGYRFNGTITATPDETATRVLDELLKPTKFTWKYVVFALALITIAATVLWMFYPRQYGGTNNIEQKAVGNISFTRLTRQSNVYYPTLSPDGRLLAFSVIEGDGSSLWLKDMTTGESRMFLPKVVKGYRGIRFAPDSADLYFVSSENVLERIGISESEPREVLRHVPNPFAVSPDGTQVVFMRGINLILARTDGSNERVLAVRNGESHWFSASTSAPDWSPDGSAIVVSGGYIELGKKHADVVKISVRNGSEQRIATPDWPQIGDVAWVNSGSLFVTARENSGAPSQIWQISLSDGSIRRITNDLHSYERLSLSADRRSLATTQHVGGSNIWIGSVGNRGDFKQITFNEAEIVGRAGVAFLPDGKIVYSSPSSGNMDIWVMDPDGSGQRQLTSNFGDWNGRQVATSDGKFIVFVSTKTGGRAIWRMRTDGGEPVQLTRGKGEDHPAVSGDETVYYDDSEDSASSIWKISIHGGEPEQVSGDYDASNPAISPDGKYLAFFYAEKGAKDKIDLCVMDLQNKEITKRFNTSAFRQVLQWTADSRSIVYIAESSPNLFVQPIDGGVRSQLTFFNLEETWNFALSPDSKTIAVARGYSAAEAVLIGNLP